jgi:DNA-binding Lrp family transcriptional regulator
MKEQDLVILLKKLTTKGSNLSIRKLAEELGMSASSVSESLERSKQAQLVDRNKKRVNVLALQEFLIHGVAYVFPAQAGRIGRGVPTYVSASPLKEQLAANVDTYVWHHVRGTARGQQIEPLYPSVPEAVLRDEELYQWLVIVDALRMGRAREKEIAINELNKRFERYAENQ